MDRVDIATMYGALVGSAVSILTPREHPDTIDRHLDTGIRMNDWWPTVGMVAGGLAGGYITAQLFGTFNPVTAGILGGGLGAVAVLLQSTGLDDVTHFFW